MTTRRSELDSIILRHDADDNCTCSGKEHNQPTLVEDLMAWADRWTAAYQVSAPTSERKRVSKVEIKEVLFDEAHWLSAEAADAIAGSIMALLGVEEEKPKLCKCMDEYNYRTNWKFCPFCGAPRPVEKGSG